MASIYELKPRFQALLRPVVSWLAAKNVTPNAVTTAALFLAAFTGALLLSYPGNQYVLLFVPLALFVRMALNAIDGMLAREHGMQTPLGAIYNELADVAADALVYLPLAGVIGARTVVTAFVMLGVLSEVAGLAALLIGADRRYDGPLGKSDRAFAIGAICFILGCGAAPGIWLMYANGLLVILAAMTISNRTRRALDAATKPKVSP